MLRFFIGIIGIGFSYVLLRYREPIGDSLGQPAWAAKVGGIYNVVILLGILIFFWAIAYMSGTLGILLAPFQYLPGAQTTAFGS